MVSADCLDASVMPAHRYEQLVQSVVDYAIYMLDPSGHVVSWNAGAQRIKGYRRDEVIGKHFSLFFTPQDCADGRPERLLCQALLELRHLHRPVLRRRIRLEGPRRMRAGRR